MISKQLRNIRLDKDLTLVDVAFATGLSIETIRRAERGIGNLNIRTAHKLSKFIDRHTNRRSR